MEEVYNKKMSNAELRQGRKSPAKSKRKYKCPKPGFGTKDLSPRAQANLEVVKEFVYREYDDAVSLMENGNFEEAIAHCTAAMVDKVPTHYLRAKYKRGICYLQLGDEEWALQDFNTLLGDDPKFNKNAHIYAALCCKRTGDYVSAIRYLSRGITTFAHFPHALMARADLFDKIQKFDKALVDFKKLLSQYPDQLDAIRGLGDAHRGLGDFDSALTCYIKAVEYGEQALQKIQSKKHESIALPEGMHEDDVDAEGREIYKLNFEAQKRQCADLLCEGLFKRAMLYRILDERDLALMDLQRIIILEGTPKKWYLFWIGKIMVEKGQIADAISFITNVLKIDEDKKKMKCQNDENKENCDQGNHDHEEAYGLLEDFMEPELLTLLASMLMTVQPISLRDYSKAVQYLKKASQTVTAKSMIHTKTIALAAEALQQGHAQKCLVLLEKVPMKTAKEKVIFSMCDDRIHVEGRIEYEARRVRDKMEKMAKGDEMDVVLHCNTFLDFMVVEDDQCPLIHELQTCAYFALGQLEDALASARKAETSLVHGTQSDYNEYNRNLIFGLLKRDDLEIAIAHFTKAIILYPLPCVRMHRAVSLCRLAFYHVHNFKKCIQMIKDALKDVHAVLGDSKNASKEDVQVAYYINAICNYCLLDQKAAWESYEIVKKGSPGGYELNVLGSQILGVQGRFEECIKLCDKVIAQKSDSLPCPYITKAKCLIDSDGHEALNNIKKAVEVFPEHLDIQMQLGDAYFYLARYKEAIIAYGTCDKRKLNPRLPFQQSLVKLALGKVNAATNLALECSQLNPGVDKVKELHDGMTSLQDFMRGHFTRAQGKFTNILLKQQDQGGAVDKGNSDKYQFNMNAYEISNYRGEGHPDLRENVEKFQTVFTAYELLNYRGLCHLYNDACDKAIQDFETAIEVLHKLYESTNLYKKHLSLRRLAPELQDKNEKNLHEIRLRYNCALAYLVKKEYDRALPIFKNLLPFADSVSENIIPAPCDGEGNGDDEPDITDADDKIKGVETHKACIWFLMGLCYISQEQVNEAKDAFLRSYALNPNYVDTYLGHLSGDECNEKDMEDEAIRRFQPIFAQDQQNTNSEAPVRRILEHATNRPMSRGWSATCQKTYFSPKAGASETNGGLHALPFIPLPVRRKFVRNIKLPTKKIQFRDLSIKCHVYATFPFVCPPGCEIKVDWSLLDHVTHERVTTLPAYPWAS